MHLAKISEIIIILSITLLYTISKSISAPSYICNFCSNTTSFATNSEYHTNLNSLFRSLSSNATTNPSGFDITSAGNSTSDAVYGLFLCRGDQNITACNDCVKAATTTDLPKTYCPNRKIAVIWYDECMVRYSDKPLLGKMDQAPKTSLINTQNKNWDFSDIDILVNTLNDLAVQAANTRTGKKYATNSATYSSLNTLYAMAQCTPDLTASDCNQCLTTAKEQLQVLMGARILQPSCFVRYETYPFYNGTSDFSLPPSPLPSPPPSQGTNSTVTNGNGESTKRKRRLSSGILFVAIPTLVAILIFILYGLWSLWSSMHKRKAMEASTVKINDIRSVESLQFSLGTIKTATRNFSADSKLGEGGFGEVYKGKLDGGLDIAVKRLSTKSVQGVTEFKTEVVLVAKLQHKNLVKLIGFCAESIENILVYEFLPNSSLDRLLFDPANKASLNWQTRLRIILGVARGLLYLHEDSRLKIIHRDLKPSNILLDEAMNPKISDFGLAKLFNVDETQGDTKRIVGTYGYMAPEYAITGHYSVKSDVYSFGVIMLELISGQRSRFFGRPQLEEALLHRAWRLWNEHKALDLVDPALDNKFPMEEVFKCIHVGLLCVQGEAFERPTMTTIIGALTGQSIDIPIPKLPHFFGTNNIIDEDHQHISPTIYSGTMMITNVYPRE